MNRHSLFAFATVTTLAAFTSIGCASPSDDDDDDNEGTESAESAQSGTTRPNACPQNHVCVYEHRDYNIGKPNAWAWQFGPEEFGRAGGWDRRFTTGKDKASSIINNTGTTTTIPSFVRVDCGLVWRRSESLEAGLWVENLSDAGHVEFSSQNNALLGVVPRKLTGRLTLRF